MIRDLILKNKTPFYIFDKCKFEASIENLRNAFLKYYDKFSIAYSYKTNYTPNICKSALESGTYAEIVSDMEGYIAIKIGVPYDKIIFNGPYKLNYEKYLENGSIIVIDNLEEAEKIFKYVDNKKGLFRIAFRLNYEVIENKISRFGFDVLGDDIKTVINKFSDLKNVKICGIQCHIGGARGLDAWVKRTRTMLDLSMSLFKNNLEFIDLGSGMFGEMEKSLAVQFSNNIPTFEDYAKSIGSLFNEQFKQLPYDNKPMLIVEPGTTLVANAVNFYAEVVSIKEIRGKNFAVLNCSSQNIGILSTKKNLPITIFNAKTERKDVDFVGYTCIEADTMYRGYNGKLDVGSIIEFRNAGSYSVNMKPPFIMPNVEMYELDSEKETLEIIKRKEEYDDIFATYKF